MEESKLKVIDKIEALVGADDFKARMRELAAVIPEAVEKDILDTLYLRNYIFSIDRGCGFTACLNLMKELLEESGKAVALVTEGHLDKDGKFVTNPGYGSIPFLLKKTVDIIGIDITGWIEKIRTPEFRRALMERRKFDDKTIYVFRIPSVEPQVMKKIHDAIYDVMYVTDVYFEPLTPENCFKYASGIAEKKGYPMKQDAADTLNKKIEQEKADGKFYGFDTIKKVVNEVVFNKLLSKAEKGGDEDMIGADDIASVTLPNDKARDPLSAFDALVGMENIKEQVSEIISQIKYLRSRRGISMPCIHMKFVGNPGTGKTTVARIVGEVLAECGVLKNGSFFEYTARALIGRYIGETEARTAEICREAYGSVLFIDEAYSLSFSNNDDRDFGKEALSVLVSEMENHREDLVVIMAGYEEEMEQMMKANVGIESRMPYKIVFKPYTPEQLYEIFMRMVGEDFEHTKKFEKAAKEYFRAIPKEVTGSRSFANARFARNLYERCQRKMLTRCMNSNKKIILDECDFTSAASEDEFTFKKNASSIGF